MRTSSVLPLSVVSLVALGSSAQAATTIALAGGDSYLAEATLPAIQTVLESEGYEVTIVAAADIDTVEEISAFDAILIGDSGHGDHDWHDFDAVLDDYVEGGGGVLFSGWVPYFASGSTEPNLVDLLPVAASMAYESAGITITAGGASALSDDWTSFTTPSFSNHGGGTKDGASVDGTTSGGNDSIVYWEVGDGRVLHLSANYLVRESTYSHSSLYDGSNPDALQSFLNGVEWVSGGASADECSTLPYIALEGAGNNADEGESLEQIQTLLEAMGWMVDIVVAEDIDTLEEIEVYDAVLLGESGSYDDDWAELDPVLLDYVEGGGGLLGSGWIAYFIDYYDDIPNIVELMPIEGWYGSFPSALDVTPSGAHEITDGWSEYTVANLLDVPSGVKTGADVSAYDSSGNASIVHWEYSDGRVVFMSANYMVRTGYGNEPLWDGTEPDAWTAFVNATEWVANACGDPDEDGDGYPASEDCDDGDAAVFPGAEEICDGIDNDCDDDVDEGDASDAGTWYYDGDEDGYGDPDDSTTACEAPDGYVDNSGDCDDGQPLAWSGAIEVCDDVDNDCDGGTDDDAVDAGTWYHDGDDDGYGDPTDSEVACDAPDDHVANDADCNDDEPLAWTGRPEVCDGVDNDCDGGTDDDAVDAATWYADTDEDGYGDPATGMDACTEPDGYVDNDGDCDDDQPLAWTDAAELCDGVDNDCDGTADNDDAVDASTWYGDGDGDGYGVAEVTTTACVQPDGYADNTDDCDDDEPLAWTGATEVCDDVDNDCDGSVDNDATDASTWYADADGDGYTVADDSVTDCNAPDGYAAENGEDCDDGDASAYPGATEVEDDGIDQDCDGEDATAGSGDGGGDGGGTDSGVDGDDGGGDDGKGCSTVGSTGFSGVWLLAALGGMLVRRRRR